MPFGMRCATPMEDWRSFKFTVTESAGHDHGDLVMVVDTAGFVFIAEPQYDTNGCQTARHVDIGDEIVLVYVAEKVELCKLQGSGEAFPTPGMNVYWSGIAGSCVSSILTSGWFKIGINTEPAGEDDEFVEIDLEGWDAEAV